MTTVRELIKGSLRLINVISANEEPAADDVQLSQEALNALIDSKSNDLLNIHTVTPYRFTLASGVPEYKLGPALDSAGNPTGADWVVQRPMRIENAVLMLFNSVLQSSFEFNEVAEPPAPAPTAFFFDDFTPSPNTLLWDNGTGHVADTGQEWAKFQVNGSPPFASAYQARMFTDPFAPANYYLGMDGYDTSMVYTTPSLSLPLNTDLLLRFRYNNGGVGGVFQLNFADFAPVNIFDLSAVQGWAALLIVTGDSGNSRMYIKTGPADPESGSGLGIPIPAKGAGFADPWSVFEAYIGPSGTRVLIDSIEYFNDPTPVTYLGPTQNFKMRSEGDFSGTQVAIDSLFIGLDGSVPPAPTPPPPPPPPPAPGPGSPSSYSVTDTNSATQNTHDINIPLIAGQTLSIGTTNLPGADGVGDTYLRLFDPFGTEVATNDDYIGVLSFIQHLAAHTGTYVLKAGCYSASACEGTVVWEIT